MPQSAFESAGINDRSLPALYECICCGSEFLAKSLTLGQGTFPQQNDCVEAKITAFRSTNAHFMVGCFHDNSTNNFRRSFDRYSTRSGSVYIAR